MRVLKVIIASWAITFGVGLVALIVLLWVGGPTMAGRVWTSPYLLIAWVLGLAISARYIR